MSGRRTIQKGEYFYINNDAIENSTDTQVHVTFETFFKEFEHYEALLHSLDLTIESSEHSIQNAFAFMQAFPKSKTRYIDSCRIRISKYAGQRSQVDISHLVAALIDKFPLVWLHIVGFNPYYVKTRIPEEENILHDLHVEKVEVNTIPAKAMKRRITLEYTNFLSFPEEAWIPLFKQGGYDYTKLHLHLVGNPNFTMSQTLFDEFEGHYIRSENPFIEVKNGIQKNRFDGNMLTFDQLNSKPESTMLHPNLTPMPMHVDIPIVAQDVEPNGKKERAKNEYKTMDAELDFGNGVKLLTSIRKIRKGAKVYIDKPEQSGLSITQQVWQDKPHEYAVHVQHNNVLKTVNATITMRDLVQAFIETHFERLVDVPRMDKKRKTVGNKVAAWYYAEL